MLMAATIERRLAWEGCHNARDLGGYPTADGGYTQFRRFVRADTLQRLSAAGQAALIDYGVRTIVDLRLPPELEVGPNPFSTLDADVRYLHHSLIDPEQLFELAGAADLAEHYRDNLVKSGSRITAILETMSDADEGAVLFHCQGGQDRTGLISAFLLDIAGVPEETIVADYALTQDCMREANTHHLEHGPGERAERERELAFFTPHAQVMIDTFAFLHQEFGGPSGYLRQSGLAESTRERLRDRLMNT